MDRRLEQFRVYLGYKSRKEFATYLGVPSPTYNHWESGKIPPQHILLKLSELGLNLNWFFTGEGDMIGKNIVSERELGRLEGKIETLQEQIERYEKRIDKYDSRMENVLKKCEKVFFKSGDVSNYSIHKK